MRRTIAGPWASQWLLAADVTSNHKQDTMADLIKVNSRSSRPKYQQLMEAVIASIEKGTMKRGQQIPSINEMADQHRLSKATVAKSYDALRERGIIKAHHGKGFYITSTEVRNSLNLFVLFDTLNAYKQILYNSLKGALPADSSLSIFFHHYNLDVFRSLVINNLGNFSHYAVMPHFDQDVSAILRRIPREKLLIIDKDVKGLDKGYSAVFQDFESDVFHALTAHAALLAKYSRLVVVKGRNHFQYVPADLIKGIRKFARQSPVPVSIVEELNVTEVTKGEAWLLFSDSDLVGFLKHTARQRWMPGKDIGLISYDDTPLKEILAGGVSVITTDFEQMGRTAAAMILGRTHEKKPNPGKFILRNTL